MHDDMMIWKFVVLLINRDSLSEYKQSSKFCPDLMDLQCAGEGDFDASFDCFVKEVQPEGRPWFCWVMVR